VPGGRSRVASWLLSRRVVSSSVGGRLVPWVVVVLRARSLFVGGGSSSVDGGS
jgi:hypothetical protein